MDELALVLNALATLAKFPLVKIEWEQDRCTITATYDGHDFYFQLDMEAQELRYLMEERAIPKPQLKASARVDNQWVLYGLTIAVVDYRTIYNQIRNLEKNNTTTKAKAVELFGIDTQNFLK